MNEFDFIVIGGGSAGYSAAREATALGLKTAVIEGGETVGGLCILKGCMPSKTLIESANRFITIRRASEFGLRASHLEVHADEIIARKRRLIGEFADYRREQLETGNFTFLRGVAEFEDAHTLKIASLDNTTTETIRFKTALISTGSRITSPPLQGLEEVGYLTSDDVLDLPKLPTSLAVLGAGPIALEMAHYFAGLGTKVTIIQRSSQFLTGNDPDVAGAIEHAFRERGIQVFTGTKLLRFDQSDGVKRVVFEHKGQEISVYAQEILNALGRSPNTNGLNLEKAGVEIEKARIKICSTQQTSREHIFSAGDVCGPLEIVHIAIEQGALAARNAARLVNQNNSGLEEMDYRLKLFAVFTEPQAAFVGLSEQEAQAQGIPYRTAKHLFNDHGKSMVMAETEGFVKLLAHTETGEILGGACVGPHASDLIHEVVVAMAFRSTAKQFAAIPHYHPTLSEIWTYPASELAEEG